MGLLIRNRTNEWLRMFCPRVVCFFLIYLGIYMSLDLKFLTFLRKKADIEFMSVIFSSP